MKLILFFVIILLLGCSNTYHIAGSYGSNGTPDSFDLNGDSTFSYSYRGIGHLYKYSSGIWTIIDRNKIVLRSYIKSTTLILKVDSSKLKDNSLDMNALSLIADIGGDSISNFRVYLYINDSFYLEKRLDSLTQVKVAFPIYRVFVKIMKRPWGIANKGPVSTILNSDTLDFKRIVHTELLLKTAFNDSLFYYQTFDDKLILMKNGKLIFSSSGNQTEYIPRLKMGA